MKVYILIINEIVYFLRNFSNLLNKINYFDFTLTLDDYNINKQFIEEQNYYFIDNDDYEIMEFDFDENEPIEFMKCSGYERESNFIIKKNNHDFLIETFTYMDEQVYLSNDYLNIINTLYRKQINHDEKLVVFESEPTTTTFTLIYNIRFENILDYE